MHLTRNATSKLLPIPRKGTKYVAKASHNPNFAVPLVLAVRDMLHLAKTAREVREMIKTKSLKINGKVFYEFNSAIQLFQILQADKLYRLELLPTGKFTLVETKDESKLCKVIGKTLLPGNKIQFNLNDGSNLLTKEKLAIGDSVYLSFEGKLKKHISLAKGCEVVVISGKYAGSKAKAIVVESGLITLKLNGKETSIPSTQVVAF